MYGDGSVLLVTVVLHNGLQIFFISEWNTWPFEVWWKFKCINHLLFSLYIYIYTLAVVIIHYGDNITSFIAMVWPIKSFCGFIFSTTHVQGYPIGLVSQSNHRAMCNWSNNCLWGHYGHIIFRVVFTCGITGYNSIRVYLVSDTNKPTKKYNIMSVFPVLCYCRSYLSDAISVDPSYKIYI